MKSNKNIIDRDRLFSDLKQSQINGDADPLRTTKYARSKYLDSRKDFCMGVDKTKATKSYLRSSKSGRFYSNGKENQPEILNKNVEKK